LIYICIPAYNEAATIGVLLWKIRQVMSEFPRDYELLVLNDESTDQTEDVLAPYLRVLPLTVLRSEKRQGYAASLERLIREAVSSASHPRRDVIVTLQADFSDPPEEIPALIKRIEGGADVVEGTREGLPPAPGPRGLRWTRRILAWILRRAPLPEGVRDPVSGFRAYRVAVLKKALAESNGSPLLSREGWAANVELLLAIAPYTRRVEGAELEERQPRKQRETRFRPWDTLVQVWEVARSRDRRPPPVTTPDAAG
jgi:glycosyltransferase involved in cell wall biosynthesis